MYPAYTLLPALLDLSIQTFVYKLMQENKLFLHFYYKLDINTLYAEKKYFKKN